MPSDNPKNTNMSNTNTPSGAAPTGTNNNNARRSGRDRHPPDRLLDEIPETIRRRPSQRGEENRKKKEPLARRLSEARRKALEPEPSQAAPTVEQDSAVQGTAKQTHRQARDGDVTFADRMAARLDALGLRPPQLRRLSAPEEALVEQGHAVQRAVKQTYRQDRHRVMTFAERFAVRLEAMGFKPPQPEPTVEQGAAERGSAEQEHRKDRDGDVQMADGMEAEMEALGLNDPNTYLNDPLNKKMVLTQDGPVPAAPRTDYAPPPSIPPPPEPAPQPAPTPTPAPATQTKVDRRPSTHRKKTKLERDHKGHFLPGPRPVEPAPQREQPLVRDRRGRFTSGPVDGQQQRDSGRAEEQRAAARHEDNNVPTNVQHNNGRVKKQRVEPVDDQMEIDDDDDESLYTLDDPQVAPQAAPQVEPQNAPQVPAQEVPQVQAPQINQPAQPAPAPRGRFTHGQTHVQRDGGQIQNPRAVLIGSSTMMLVDEPQSPAPTHDPLDPLLGAPLPLEPTARQPRTAEEIEALIEDTNRREPEFIPALGEHGIDEGFRLRLERLREAHVAAGGDEGEWIDLVRDNEEMRVYLDTLLKEQWAGDAFMEEVFDFEKWERDMEDGAFDRALDGP
ncbi:uncharacterized protein K452DRAFT_301584 [Aplosporella prunicola CBS 121167]|uniref:Uncharacterized protein n=1 Tax=Aplosporella prunicola CBS 121167 TaxID=1176127 RepID=A0A6A6B3L5_9PEZI|nr:uncharacterized protein K452DRAFT_301584 [Aplosporella prunicola CBS 121167]KAF2137855.1 hypothetical protein K452DRAFT_301584 [Aplosporella prunicola CBS 121167]